MKDEHVGFRAESDMMNRLRKEANKRDRSVSYLITEAIKKLLKGKK